LIGFLKQQQLDPRFFLEWFKLENELLATHFKFFITFAHFLNCEASTEFPFSNQDGATIFSFIEKLLAKSMLPTPSFTLGVYACVRLCECGLERKGEGAGKTKQLKFCRLHPSQRHRYQCRTRINRPASHLMVNLLFLSCYFVFQPERS
jgi:hypothetical protein